MFLPSLTTRVDWHVVEEGWTGTARIFKVTVWRPDFDDLESITDTDDPSLRVR